MVIAFISFAIKRDFCRETRLVKLEASCLCVHFASERDACPRRQRVVSIQASLFCTASPLHEPRGWPGHIRSDVRFSGTVTADPAKILARGKFSEYARSFRHAFDSSKMVRNSGDLENVGCCLYNGITVSGPRTLETRATMCDNDVTNQPCQLWH